MKIKKQISVRGEWCRIKEDIFNGDIIKILDAGKTVEGDYGERQVFKVRTKNGEKNLTFNQTSLNYLIDAFGEDTEEWIGKEVKVWLVKSNIQGKMKDVCYLTAPDWIEGADGFYPPEREPDEEDSEDISF